MAKLSYYKFVNPGSVRDKNIESITIDAKKYGIRKGQGGGGDDLGNAANAGNRKIVLGINRLGLVINSNLEQSKKLNEEVVKLNNNVVGLNKTISKEFKAEEKKKKKLENAIKRQTTLRRGAAAERSSENRVGKKDDSKVDKVAKKVGSGAKGIFGFLGGIVGAILKPLITLGILKWLEKPENAEKAAKFLEFLGKIAKFFAKIIEFGVIQTLEGLAKIFDSDASIVEKIKGFFQLAIGVFTLLGTWAILTGRVKFLLKGLKLAWTAIQALPGAMALMAKAATAIKTFAASPVGKAAILFGAGAAIPALFPGTVETETDAAVDKNKAEKGADDTLKKLEEERANVNFLDYLTGRTAELDKQIYRVKNGEEPDFGFGKDPMAVKEGDVPKSLPEVPAPGSGSPETTTSPLVSPGQKGKSVQGASGKSYLIEIDGKPQQLSPEAQKDIDDAKTQTQPLQEFEVGGVAKGPDSGYPAILHGMEAVIPLKNNFTKAGGDIFQNIKSFFGFGGEEQEKSVPEKQTLRGAIGTKSVSIGATSPDQKWNPDLGDTSVRGLLGTLITGIKYQAEMFAEVMGVELATPEVPEIPTESSDDSTSPGGSTPPAGGGTTSTDEEKSSPAGDVPSVASVAAGQAPDPGTSETQTTSADKIDSMSKEELIKLLDPTKSANSSIGSEAREKIIAEADAKGLTGEERELFKLRQTVKATQKMANGGSIRNVVNGSGLIQGPMSGYPVYMNGGMTPSFIGHGTEYVTSKANGGFVIPINTPSTKSNGGLFGRRVKEATAKGYKHPFKGFSNGGTVFQPLLVSKKEKLSRFEDKIGGDSRPKEQQKLSAGGKILEGAKKTLGFGRGQSNQCANSTRAALKAAKHPAAEKRTKKGDLDSKGTAYNGRAFAASFAGSDMGKVIKNAGSLIAGDIVLWKGGGGYGPGEITHVGIKGEGNSLYHHGSGPGFRKANMYTSYGAQKFAAGIRLDGEPGTVDDSGQPDTSDTGDASSQTDGVTPTSDEGEKKTAKVDPFAALTAAIEKYKAALGGATSAETSSSAELPLSGAKIDASSKKLEENLFNPQGGDKANVVNFNTAKDMPPIVNTQDNPIVTAGTDYGDAWSNYEGHITFSFGIGDDKELSKIK